MQKQVQDQGREHQQQLQRLDATLQLQQQQHAVLLGLLSGVSYVCACVKEHAFTGNVSFEFCSGHMRVRIHSMRSI